jgi:hypothetical protein
VPLPGRGCARRAGRWAFGGDLVEDPRRLRAGAPPAGKGFGQPRVVGFVEREVEELQVLGPVLAFQQARADDHRGHRRLLQHPARGQVGDRCAVPARDGVDRAQPRARHSSVIDPGCASAARRSSSEQHTSGCSPPARRGRLAWR